MKFSELLTLPFDASGCIDIAAILVALPDTPTEVAKQFYSDHARKNEFQVQYGGMDLDRLRWHRVKQSAGELMAASVYPDYQRWLDAVRRRPASFGSQGWECIDVRKDVQDHWAKHGTWLIPPVVLSGSLVGSSAALHIAEGHTRTGLLRGLIEHGLLPAQSMHSVWLGVVDS
jgi:hypothetical protein